VNRIAFLVAASLACTAIASAATDTPVALKTTEFGHGPTIVLLHDFGGARMQWLPTAKRLLGRYHVVMVDLPGHGESPMPDPFSLEAASAAVGQLMARQKGESTIVVGQGLGGMLALMAASRNPAAVKGVVVIDGWLKLPQPVPEQMQQYFLQALDTNYDAMLRRMFTQGGLDSTQGLALHAQASQVPPANIKAYMRQLLNADATGALKDLKPRLLFVGTEKRWPAGKTWADLAPQLGYGAAPGTMETRRIEKAAGMVWSDQPDTLAAVVSAFAGRAIAAK
jgi:pimeloyl-ACP methyl ester carboxylesterase